jgi:hypothetical protein
MLLINSICLASPTSSPLESSVMKQSKARIADLEAKVDNLQKNVDSLHTNIYQNKNSQSNSIHLTLFVAIIGFILTFIGLFINIKIKKSEFIDNLYKEFNDKDFAFFLTILDEAMDSGDDIAYINSLKSNKDKFAKFELARDKTLTFIDKLYYYWENNLFIKYKLLSFKEFEYFAYEIIIISKSKYLDKFISEYYESINNRKPDYDVRFLRKIYPFTGRQYFKEEDFENKIRKYCA